MKKRKSNRNWVLPLLTLTSLLNSSLLTASSTYNWVGTASSGQFMRDSQNWVNIGTGTSGTPGVGDQTIYTNPITAQNNPPSLLNAGSPFQFEGANFEVNIPMVITSGNTLNVGSSGFSSTVAGTESSVTIGYPTSGQYGVVTVAGPGFEGVANSSLLYQITDGGSLTLSGGGQTGAGLLNILTSSPAESTAAPGHVNTVTFDTNPATINSLISVNAQDNIIIDTDVTVGNSANQTIAGVITGTGSLTKAGIGTLNLTSTNSSFAGTMNVAAGTVDLSAATSVLPGNVNLTGGLITGIGTIGAAGKTFTSSGGTVHPGNSPGTLTVVGNHVNIQTTLAIDIVGPGAVAGTNNSLLLVQGTETIGSSSVVSVNATGGYSISTPYTILNATGGITGTFNPVVLVNGTTSIVPLLNYDLNHVYLNFQTPFLALGTNSNERSAALQLTKITAPTAAQTSLLTNITSSNTANTIAALDQLSGAQYVGLQAATESLTQRFVRRLYDPVRRVIETVNIGGCAPSHPRGTAWVSGSGGRSFFDGNHEAHGFKSSGYEVSGGAQGMIGNSLLIGGALTYDSEHYDFNISGSSGKSKSILGAIYTLYRPENFYILGDLVVGGTANNVSRQFSIGSGASAIAYSESSKPKSVEGILYVEGGLDYAVGCRSLNVLIQPFLGLEGGCYRYKKVNESGTAPVALSFSNKGYGTFDTRLGAHFSLNTNNEWLIGLDLAWKYRWTNLNNTRNVNFQSFGSSFALKGADIGRNSFDGSINVTKQLNRIWGFYITANGQKWTNANSYDLVGGITANW